MFSGDSDPVLTLCPEDTVLELWRLERKLVDRSKVGRQKDLLRHWGEQLSGEQLGVQAKSTRLPTLGRCGHSWTVDGRVRMSGRMGQLEVGAGKMGAWGQPKQPKPVAARSGAMPVPPPAPHLLSHLEDHQDGLDGDCEPQQTESVEFAEADLHSVAFSVPKGVEMRVSSVLHHLVAVSTELQLGAVFTSHQSLQMGRR